MATILLPRDFKEFLRLLNSSEVEYLVIGGYAVNYYGYPRATADMDVWVGIDPGNAQKMGCSAAGIRISTSRGKDVSRDGQCHSNGCAAFAN